MALPPLLEPDRLLAGDLVERVHRHLDVGDVDPAAVRLDPHLDVVVDHPLHGDENLHRLRLRRALSARFGSGATGSGPADCATQQG